MNIAFKYFLIYILLIISNLSYSQTTSVSGTIKGRDDLLPFVNVVLKGTTYGGLTNEQGVFQITNVPFGKYVIESSFVGFETQSIEVILSSDKPNVKVDFVLVEKAGLLEEVIISVPGGRLQKELVVNVEQRKLTDIYTVSSNTLAESIANLNGVSQNTTGNSIGKPVIRGLTSNRVVTYAQGTRIENQQWGAEHGLGISNNGIKSVEVIKGPASLLYGSDAIGGVLYFVDEGFTSKKYEGQVSTGFFTNSLTTQNKIGFKTDLGLLKLNVFGGYNSAADYQTPSQGRVFNTRFNEKSLKVALGLLKKNSTSRLTYSYLNNFFGIPAIMPFTESTSRDFILPFQDITQQNLSLENNLNIGKTTVDLTLGYANNDRQEFNDVADAADLHLNLSVYSYNLKVSDLITGSKFDLVLGTQGLYQVNENRGTTFLIPDGQSSEVGVYALLNYDPTNRLGLQTGLRFDSKNIQAESVVIDGITNFSDFDNTYSTVNYSIGSKYEIGNVTLRFNIASGYRAPNTSELLSNGEHGGVGRIEVGDPSLVSEVATQFDFAINYQKSGLNFIINPFYNTINNYIFIAPTNETGEGGLPIFAYLQEDAVLYGGEFAFVWQPARWSKVSLQSNTAITFGEDNQNNPLPLITPVNVNSRIAYELGIGNEFKLNSAYLQVQNYLSQNRVSEFELPNEAYTLVNLGFNATYKSFAFDFTVKNLFNVNYVDHLSRLKTVFEEVIIPNQGRDFTFTLNARF